LPESPETGEAPLVFPYPHQNRHLVQVAQVVGCYERLADSRQRLVRWGVAYFWQMAVRAMPLFVSTGSRNFGGFCAYSMSWVYT